MYNIELYSPEELTWPPKIWRNTESGETISFDYPGEIEKFFENHPPGDCSRENKERRETYKQEIIDARAKKLEEEDPAIELLKIKVILLALEASRQEVLVGKSHKLYEITLTKEVVEEYIKQLKERLPKISDHTNSDYIKALRLYKLWKSVTWDNSPDGDGKSPIQQYFRNPRNPSNENQKILNDLLNSGNQKKIEQTLRASQEALERW